jgi:hypothetical protein
MYAVKVSFCQQGNWSRNYTYKSEVKPEVGEAVVVPTGKWFGVGKVMSVHDGDTYDWKSDIRYSEVILRMPI